MGSASMCSAGMGSASMGSASVGSAGKGSASITSASIRSASVGSASVGSSMGSASIRAASPGFEPYLAHAELGAKARLDLSGCRRGLRVHRQRRLDWGQGSGSASGSA